MSTSGVKWSVSGFVCGVGYLFLTSGSWLTDGPWNTIQWTLKAMVLPNGYIIIIVFVIYKARYIFY